MILQITDDNLNELDEFLGRHQNITTEWVVVVHSENYVEIDTVDEQIKIPHSSEVIYALWEKGMQRFINKGDSIYLASEVIREFSKMMRVFKNCKVRLDGDTWRLETWKPRGGIEYNAVSAFHSAQFYGNVRDIVIYADGLSAAYMFMGSNINSVTFRGVKFLHLIETFAQSRAEVVRFEKCGCKDEVSVDVPCRDIFTCSTIKRIEFVDCESKLIDSILYELNMWDDFDNVEVIITESEVIK
jgi:hypothetical protein